ncbi:MAG: hypothetical protein AAGD25_26240 [Cyanobacteria bacterium P01_F01_bin.150]
MEAKNPCFFIVGDQVSSLPGWQEGAIASALNAISRLSHPDLPLPTLTALPDTRLMVEGLRVEEMMDQKMTSEERKAEELVAKELVAKEQ